MIKSDFSYLTPLFIKRSRIKNFGDFMTDSVGNIRYSRILINAFNNRLCRYQLDDYIQFKSKTVLYLKRPRK